MRGQSVMAMTSWQQEYEIPGHTASVVKKQRDQCSCPTCFLIAFSAQDGSLWIGSVVLRGVFHSGSQNSGSTFAHTHSSVSEVIIIDQVVNY